MAELVPDPPPICRQARIVTLSTGTALWHVWRTDGTPGRSPTAFNPGRGIGRFHPIADADGTTIPTWYGATGDDAAIFESVFHDVLEAVPDQRVYRKDVADRMLTEVRLLEPLALADLTTTGRHRLRVDRAGLIDPTGPAAYARTARWAEFVHRCTPRAQGLIWPARRFDTERAVVLFGDRVGAAALEAVGGSRPLDIGPGLDHVLTLAEAADIMVTMG